MDAGKLPTPVLQRSRCRTISRKRSQPSRRRRQCSRFSPARIATQSSTDLPPQSGRTHARAALRSSSKCWRAAKRSTHSSVGLNDHTDVRMPTITDQAPRPPPSRRIDVHVAPPRGFPSGVIPEHWRSRRLPSPRSRAQRVKPPRWNDLTVSGTPAPIWRSSVSRRALLGVPNTWMLVVAANVSEYAAAARSAMTSM